jgi:3-oxoacyl-[acyl-carrier-protein] synthase-3
MTLSILGIGFSHSDIALSNQFLEDLDIGTNAQWIIEKIGIESRVISLPIPYIEKTRNQDPEEGLKVATTTPTELALKAISMACERAGISPSQIGMIICDCVRPNHIIPTESQRIAKALGLSCPAFEVLTACPVFALHIDFLRRFKELPEYVLAVTTSAVSQVVNYNDRSDGAIWGDGASACILSTKHLGKLKILDSEFDADPTRAGAVVIDRFGWFHQDGRAVRDFSVRQTVRLIKRAEEKFGLDWSKDVFIGHQANATMLEQITTNRKIPEQNHWHNVRCIGNQAGAGAPASLAMKWDHIKPGMRVLTAVVGAGLSWGSVLMEGV